MIEELLAQLRELERQAPSAPTASFPWMEQVVQQAAAAGEIEDQIVAWLVDNVPADLLHRAAEEVAEPDFYDGWE
jgi:hypothetical protein